MSLWRQLLDRIFNAPFGKIDPVERAQAEARGSAWTDPEAEAMVEHARRQTWEANHGKLWKRDGDTLHLTDFPITIKRVDPDQQMTFGGRFRVDCAAQTPSFVWSLEDAKFVGERWAKEIDELPLAQKECQAEGDGTDFKQGMKFQDCSVIQCIAVEDIGLVMVDTRVLRRIKDAGLTPRLAVEQGMATVHYGTLRLNGSVPLPGEGSSVKTED